VVQREGLIAQAFASVDFFLPFHFVWLGDLPVFMTAVISVVFCQEQAESCQNVKCHSFVLAALLQVFSFCSSSSSYSTFPCSGFLFLHSFLCGLCPPLLGMQASIISGSSCYFCTSTKTQYFWTQWTRVVGHNHRFCCWWPVSCCLFRVLIYLLFQWIKFLLHFSCWCLFWSRLEI